MQKQKNLDGKKVVHYLKNEDNFILVGMSAFITPTDHPDEENVVNTKPAKTSRVVEVFDDGSFETRNSFYVPV